MNSKIPVVRKFSFLSIIPQLAVMYVLTLIFYFITKDTKTGVMLGCLFYLIISRGTKAIFLIHHRKGMRLLKQHNFESAIDEFRQSLDFFQKHRWLDKYRYLFMLESSKTSYTEMALVNTAVCYVYSNDIERALEYYSQALVLFPNSDLAKNGIESIEKYKSLYPDEE